MLFGNFSAFYEACTYIYMHTYIDTYIYIYIYSEHHIKRPLIIGVGV